MKKQCQKSDPNKITGEGANLIIVDDSMRNEFSRFEKALFNHILYALTFKYHSSLTCCYRRPSGDLGVLVRKTSISKEYFPERANMQIFNGCVEVSLNGEDLRKLPLPTEKL
jgi:hypothetical protein